MSVAQADLTWPTQQLLPSFPAPKPVQDLITLRETPLRWEAEGPFIAHGTGRLDGDGWVCQTGIDTPNAHMVYGPYDTSVPAGPNTAEFQIKIDNNNANNEPQVVIDVRDATTGAVLAQRTINRMDFPVASEYVNFQLPFNLPAANHSLELRVYWLGGAYIKVDRVGVTQGPSSDEMVLFASLKGIVNFKKPRIFSYEGDAFAEGPHTWLQSLGLQWTEVNDKWSLITKYRDSLRGLIVYDPAQPDTINLATTIARKRKALIASPTLAAKLTAAPNHLPILVDYRGQFSSKLQVYQTLSTTTGRR